MILYWLIFVLFAAAALIAKDERSLAPQPNLGGQIGSTKRGSAMPALTILLLIVIIGLRYRVGGDWSNYATAYRDIVPLSLTQSFVVSPHEPGYTLISWLSAQLGGGIWLVNLLSAIPLAIGLVRFSQRLGNPALALAVATPFLIIVVGMGYTRQAAALGFLMLGLVAFIEKKSLRRFIWFVLLGALFHRAILIFIPIILIGTARTALTALAVSAFAIPVAYFAFIRVAAERYSTGYIQANLDAEGALVRVAMNLLPALILLFSQNRLYRSVEERNLWHIFALLAVGAAVALSLIESSVIVDRLSIYLIPLQLFVYTRLAEQATSSIASGIFTRALIILYSATVMFVWLNYATHARQWLPYRNYLFL